jgi:hypothetical protein
VSERTASPIIRTPREWDEPCKECDGTGIVHRREVHALWTRDEYSRGDRVLDPSNGPVPDGAYVCTAVPGCNIQQACREGIELAKRVEGPVAFEFNGRNMVCLADSSVEGLVEQFHKPRTE